MSSSVLSAPTAPASVAQSLAEVLADIVGVARVSPDDHYFDDLGADSILMARFCARVRKRADLPLAPAQRICACVRYLFDTASFVRTCNANSDSWFKGST